MRTELVLPPLSRLQAICTEGVFANAKGLFNKLFDLLQWSETHPDQEGGLELIELL